MNSTQPSRRRHARGAVIAATLLAATTTSAVGFTGTAQAASTCFNNGAPMSVNGGEINGTAGDDKIRCLALTGRDTVNGLGGNDTIQITGLLGDARVNGEAGNDTITVSSLSGQVHIDGGDDKDAITVNSHISGEFQNRSEVAGGNGDDVLSVQDVGVQSEVRGDAGNDTLNIHSVDPGGRAEGNDGNDLLRISRNATTVMAGDGDDTIEGPNGTRMTLAPGSFTDGGNGIDTCRVQRPGAGSATVADCETTP
ncbi:hypothetical protein [Streptomyces sp. Ac-502]|uniref:hypothetical protein n=1 Tax=Streptomyces sp. Ac-502 TaxID=3342801 RepID=UPI00386251EB